MLLQRFLVHLFDKYVDIIGHALQVLTQKLVLSFQELFLFLIIGKRLKNLWRIFHLLNL